MKINFSRLNNGLEINKQQIQSSIAPKTSKEDKDYKYRIDPIVPVGIAQNLILQNNRLDKAIRILAQDVILNEITYLTDEESEIEETVAKFWKNNINELYKQLQEFYSYGFGASEIIFDEETGLPIKLYQIPAETLFIKQDSNRDGTYSYYAIQKVDGKADVKMKLSRFQYDEEDSDLPTCFWLGGGKTSEFYEIPYWLPAFNSIAAKVALDELNAKKINEGNLMSGILVIRRPPAFEGQKEETKKDLEEQMKDAGTGILTLDLESFNTEIPLEVSYVPISEQNYSYLSELADRCDEDILACFSIPKVRLMIDDVTESMNSQKSNTIYEIYTKSLENEQLPFEIEINKFNRKYFKYNGVVDIETPIFSDKKDVEVGSILNLFNNGILTLGETIKAVSVYYPKLQLEYNDANPLFNERYYNGRLLGLTDYSEDDLNEANEVMTWLQS
ncbi:hypothetical protein [uncultured Methanobrevibacter sp.]|uniref:hypothetical protein n=1 Tax=uncultured Methanobrevibacter sp. TaxID=253161 RepID=UPI0025F2B100|nr:hypothetical protein [uncultured Methanobrevibacter sp.]